MILEFLERVLSLSNSSCSSPVSLLCVCYTTRLQLQCCGSHHCTFHDKLHQGLHAWSKPERKREDEVGQTVISTCCELNVGERRTKDVATPGVTPWSSNVFRSPFAYVACVIVKTGESV